MTGDHGMAIMSVLEGLEFEAAIMSNTAPLHGLVAAMLAACRTIRLFRDPTRGGVATSLNEIAALAGVGVEIDRPQSRFHLSCRVAVRSSASTRFRWPTRASFWPWFR